MSVDPNSISPGKRYVTATRHVRTVLEVTEERVRYSHGSEFGGAGQWRWQDKAKFANDAVAEVDSSESPAPSSALPIERPERTERTEAPSVPGKASGSRPTLSKRR